MMRATMQASLVVVVLCLAAGGGWADWDGGVVKMHWPQWPDLADTGIDVDATTRDPWFPPNHLADDFECTATGPITDIHIWGSFLNDQLPVDPAGNADPGGMVFRLSIHEDIPDPDEPGSGEWSKPGVVLWERQFFPGDPGYVVNLWANNLEEKYWDPTDPGGQFTLDTTCWQFNFFIDEADAFPQERGKIYWLDVQAFDPNASARWGWKTTDPNDPRTPHFMDDAVFWDPGLGEGDWNELRYPDWHPFHPESVDLAFVITPEPTTWALIGLGASALLLRRRRR